MLTLIIITLLQRLPPISDPPDRPSPERICCEWNEDGRCERWVSFIVECYPKAPPPKA